MTLQEIVKDQVKEMRSISDHLETTAASYTEELVQENMRACARYIRDCAERLDDALKETT